MPRPKPQHVYGPSGSALADARRTLRSSINRLLSLANTNPMVDGILLAVSEGQTKVKCPGLWPEADVFAVLNLISNVQSGDYHLRRCVDCAAWMLVKKSDRLICPTCRKQRASRRQARRRRAEQGANRRAFDGVQRTGT